MSFDCREYLEVAKYLAGFQNSGFSEEAVYRSSVSRAYYAAFCWARNYSQKCLGFEPKEKYQDHKLLREHLQKIDQEWVKIAHNLNTLRKWRNKCDYENSVENLSFIVKQSIRLSSEIIDKCK